MVQCARGRRTVTGIRTTGTVVMPRAGFGKTRCRGFGGPRRGVCPGRSDICLQEMRIGKTMGLGCGLADEAPSLLDATRPTRLGTLEGPPACHVRWKQSPLARERGRQARPSPCPRVLSGSSGRGPYPKGNFVPRIAGPRRRNMQVLSRKPKREFGDEQPDRGSRDPNAMRYARRWPDYRTFALKPWNRGCSEPESDSRRIPHRDTQPPMHDDGSRRRPDSSPPRDGGRPQGFRAPHFPSQIRSVPSRVQAGSRQTLSRRHKPGGEAWTGRKTLKLSSVRQQALSETCLGNESRRSVLP